MKILLKPFLLLLPLLAGLCMMNSCHKEQFSTRGALSFSTDTLTFDTVFTTLGSTTKYFLIRNTQNKSLNVSDIKLMQLAGTQFRINVDGSPGTEFKNIDVPAHDSLYVFVEVTINPNNLNNPFIVFDQVQFITNGVTQKVVLEAMGQNAYYHFSEHIKTNVTWPNDKPHIIVNKNGGLPILAIDTTGTLNIPGGCQIYMGPGAVMTVDGILNTTATSWSDSIVFQYIRTDYPNQPGQWLGITYSRIATVNMSHTIIDQSTFGLSDEYVLDLVAQSQITTSNLNTYSSNPIPSVTLDKVIIRNASSTAMSAIRTNLTATNCLFFSCSQSLVQLGMGGTYNINNCTLSNGYSPYTSSQSPILSIIDAVSYLNVGPVIGPFATTANINNTIVAGAVLQNGNDLGFGLIQPSSDVIRFKNCLLTESIDTLLVYQPTAISDSCFCIGDPQAQQPQVFSYPYYNNYMPDSASMVLNRAVNYSPKDLFDFSRNGSYHGLGAIEWHH